MNFSKCWLDAWGVPAPADVSHEDRRFFAGLPCPHCGREEVDFRRDLYGYVEGEPPEEAHPLENDYRCLACGAAWTLLWHWQVATPEVLYGEGP